MKKNFSFRGHPGQKHHFLGHPYPNRLGLGHPGITPRVLGHPTRIVLGHPGPGGQVPGHQDGRNRGGQRRGQDPGHPFLRISLHISQHSRKDAKKKSNQKGKKKVATNKAIDQATKEFEKKKKAFTLIETKSGRFFVVFHTTKKEWMLPGGLCDHNEDYRTAALRETREEWGGRLNNLTHLYTTPDNAAIFLSKDNFRNTTHDQRVKIFRSRTTPWETSDYGFYNPETGKVESYSGVDKLYQNFLEIALRTIKNVRSNYRYLL